MSIKSVNKKYQNKINTLYSHYRNYHNIVNLDGTFETDKEQRLNDRKQLQAFDKYYNLFGVLPKREQSNFERQHKAIHGYT